MISKFIPYILLLLSLIEGVISQGQPSFPQGQRHHPNDEPFFDMERQGRKPKEVKFENSNNPNLNVEIAEVKDFDESNDIITNKSKLKITWTVNKENNPNAPLIDTIAPTVFKIKLLSNVTEDSETKLFYPYVEQEIASNIVQQYEYEYKVPKLDENYVYNIAVIADPVGVSKNNSVGLSRTLVYKLYESSAGAEDNDKKENGINPLVFVGIGIAAVVIIALAFLISKRISRNDKHIDDDDVEYNLPNSTSPIGNSFKNEQELDRISVVTDNNSEVSWSNLEIAQESHQTKNDANDRIYRTLDKKGYKRDNKPKDNRYEINENQLYKVVRMFIPTEEDEIKLNIGDDVEITTIFEDGWCEGINKSSNEGGVFPRTCVVEAEQFASLIEKSKGSLLPTRRRSKRNSYSQVNRYKSSDSMKNNTIPEMD